MLQNHAPRSFRGFVLGIVGACAAGLVWNAAPHNWACALPMQPPASAPIHIATVDMLAVVERLVLSDKYAPAREDLAKSKNALIEPMVAKLQDIETKARAMKPDAPELQGMQQEYMQSKQQLDQASTASQQEMEKLNVAQLTEAYKLVLESADALSAELGYSHLVGSRSGVVAFRSVNVDGLLQEMLARPMLRAEARDDLTQKLIDKMGLAGVIVPTVGSAPGTPVPAPVSAPASAPGK